MFLDPLAENWINNAWYSPYAVVSRQVVPVTASGFTVVDARKRRTSKWSWLTATVGNGIAYMQAAVARMRVMIYILLIFRSIPKTNDETTSSPNVNR
jgi:hypothetical protein